MANCNHILIVTNALQPITLGKKVMRTFYVENWLVIERLLSALPLPNVPSLTVSTKLGLAVEILTSKSMVMGSWSGLNYSDTQAE